jgi:hypothetical protein
MIGILDFVSNAFATWAIPELSKPIKAAIKLANLMKSLRVYPFRSTSS